MLCNRNGSTAVLLALGLIALCCFQASPSMADAPHSPLSPKESLRQMRIAPGLSIELVASEPQVIDPVAIRFDEDGRMWVVEMRDYPHGPAEGAEPQSRIKILEDLDGDGRYETARTFADHLLFVTGVLPWQGGAFVTMAGEVAYMKDTTGDGRADQRETWYTGFAQQNTQLRANHPRLGLDNQIYIANGLRGGSVIDARHPKSKPLEISGMDFRFDPFTRKFEAMSGVGQFGLTFDDYGNRFVVSNRNPVKHIVLENRYLMRNPNVRIPTVFHDVATAGAASRVFPISRAWTTSTLHAGQFTAACGVKIYRGDLLPNAFYGNAFTCDPTGNFVHREVMKPSGATFTSKPGRAGVEFLASTDEWFRPVNLEVGPDGALYVMDMYRAVIEHPQFMPDELKRRPDLRHGDDRGRIYRIVPSAGRRATPRPQFSQSDNGELVKALESSNSWQRETAARLLLERQDKSCQDDLEQLVKQSKLPVARLQALWSLEGLALLKQEHVSAALTDDSARVREQAVRLSEAWLADSPALRRQVAKLAADGDAKVRFQVALSLAPSDGDAELAAMQRVLLFEDCDVWTRRAVTIAASSQAAALATAILDQTDWSAKPSSSRLDLTGELIAMGAKQGRDQQRQILLVISNLQGEYAPGVQQSALLALLKGDRSSLSSIGEEAGEKPLKQSILAIIDRAGRIASNVKNADALRGEAVELLSMTDQGKPTVVRLALSDPSQAVRARAISALGRYSDLEPWKQLLASFRRESPALRQAILSGVLARSDRTSLLLDELAAGRMKAGEIDRSSTTRLLKHRDAKLRARAVKLMADAIPADRKKVLADYQVALAMKADPKLGMAVFKKNCAVCHRIGEIGVNVAPDIADSRSKQPTQILADILQPNRAIDANYVSYSVETVDGRVLTGILASETASSITLRQQEDKTLTLLRSEIELLQSNGVSLMPVGLEKDITHQQMANLISFIKNWRYLDGRTPLGK